MAHRVCGLGLTPKSTDTARDHSLGDTFVYEQAGAELGGGTAGDLDPCHFSFFLWPPGSVLPPHLIAHPVNLPLATD